MTARWGRRALRVGKTARGAAVACALAAASLHAGCGETKGLILGEAPGGAEPPIAPDAAVAAPLPDASPYFLDAGPPCAACSVPVALDGATLTAQQGGTGGTPYTDTCPGNEVIIGYQGFLTPASVGLILVGGIQAVCADLVTSGSAPVQITTSVGATLPIRGMSQDSPWTQTCPANEVVVGFSGQSGDDLDQVAFECAPWFVSGSNDDAGGALSIGSIDTFPPSGGDGGMPFEVACPPGQMARGDNGRSGQWIDAFGLVCGTPSLAADGGAP